MGNFDELIERYRQEAENLEMQPSPKVWEGVAFALEEGKRKKRFAWWWWLVGALLLGSLYLLYAYKLTDDKQVATSHIRTPHEITPEINQQPIPKIDVQREVGVIAAPNAEVKQEDKSTVEVNDKDQSEGDHSLIDNAVKETVQKQPVKVDKVIKENMHARAKPADVKEPVLPQKNPNDVVPVRGNIASVQETDEPVTESGSMKDPTYREVVTVIKLTPRESELYRASMAKKYEEKMQRRNIDLGAPVMDDEANDVVPDSNEKKKKWSVYAGAMYGANRINMTESGSYQFIKHYYDSTRKKLNTFNYNAGVAYDLSPRLRLQLNIGYSKLAEQLTNRQVVYGIDTVYTQPKVIINTPTSGSNFDTSFRTVRRYYDINGDSTGMHINSASYFTLGAGITYWLFDSKKLRVGITPAVAYNMLIGTKGYVYNADSTYVAADKTNIRSMFSVEGSLNLEYKLSKNLNIALSPVYKTYLGNAYKTPNTMYLRYNQVGGQATLRYYFR